MDSAAIYDAIRNTVQGCLPGARVLLFGSHARGDNDHHSDYDLLVITPNMLSRKEKLSWSSQLHKIIEKQTLPGHIVRTAIKEGIAL